MTEEVLHHVIKLDQTDLNAQEAVNDVIQSKVSKEKAA
jgi:hypothetical protein